MVFVVNIIKVCDYWAQGQSGRVRKISPQLEFDPRTVLTSRYTDYAILAPSIYVEDVIPVCSVLH